VTAGFRKLLVMFFYGFMLNKEIVTYILSKKCDNVLRPLFLHLLNWECNKWHISWFHISWPVILGIHYLELVSGFFSRVKEIICIQN
jgi:hypothetical protein